MRAGRPGQLATHVVLPGVLYGAGEDDAHLHELFKAAWGGGSVPLVGAGTNRIPTLHVSALAGYVAALAAASAQSLDLAALAAAATGPIARRALQQTLQATLSASRQGPGQMGSSDVVSAVGAAAPPSYLVVAEEVPVTQSQLIMAASKAFGNQLSAHVERLGSEEALMLSPFSGANPGLCCLGNSSADASMQRQRQVQRRGILMLQSIDLPLRTTQLAVAPLPAPRSPGGILDALESVVAEMLDARSLTPLRVLIRGAPASGKSLLAERLARLYGLPLVRASTILAEAAHCDTELQKVRER